MIAIAILALCWFQTIPICSMASRLLLLLHCLVDHPFGAEALKWQWCNKLKETHLQLFIHSRIVAPVLNHALSNLSHLHQQYHHSMCSIQTEKYHPFVLMQFAPGLDCTVIFIYSRFSTGVQCRIILNNISTTLRVFDWECILLLIKKNKI